MNGKKERFFRAVKERKGKGGGPQGGNKKPKMDFKGKPAGYFDRVVRGAMQGRQSVVKTPHGGNQVPLAHLPQVNIKPEQAKKMIESLRKREEQRKKKK